MTFDYKITPVRNNDVDSAQEISGFSRRKKTFTRKFKKDRRKDKRDRRSGVRDGVIVSLSSSKNNRRKGVDRRRQISRYV